MELELASKRLESADTLGCSKCTLILHANVFEYMEDLH